ncbi:MAG: metal-binding protein [Crocosphaera sp.]|nr:metal-binding protein [Crocosphaera sp.]
MPSGRTHDRITLISLPPLAMLGLIFIGQGEWIVWFSGAYLFSGLMFGPDLDIYSIQYKRWGAIRWLWLPYQKCLRHRSFFSHGLIVGTVIRVVYLLTIVFIVAIFVVSILQSILGFDWNWKTFIDNQFNLIKYQYPEVAIASLMGLELGAMSHSLSDYLVSYWKKSEKKPKKRRRK